MREPSEPDQTADDVEGHLQLTPDQAQERAQAARRERERRDAAEGAPGDRDT